MSANVILADRERAIAALESIDDSYSQQAKAFTRYLRETGKPIEAETLREYFQTLRESSYRANTINALRSAAKVRVRQLAAENPALEERLERLFRKLDRDPLTAAVRLNSRAVESSRYFTPAEIKRILAGCRSDRQRLFVRFLYTTGCRVSELIGVRLTDLEACGGSVRVSLLGKGRKQRYVRIPIELFEQIRQTFGGSTYLFETSAGRPYHRVYVTAQLKKITGAVLGKPLGAHAFRHSFATAKIRQTGKIEAVSRYLGHSTPSVTLAFYSHQELEDAELFEL